MTRRSIHALITLGFLLLTTAAASGKRTFADHYQQYLNGKMKLDQATLDSMYEAFKIQYHNEGDVAAPSSHYKSQGINRKSIFEATVQGIIQHNSHGNNTWEKGINQFSDMTEDEFRDYFHLVGDQQQCSATHEAAKKLTIKEVRDVPAHWDWRDMGVVTPVKNQAKCGSCWTFSTVGCMESHFMKKYGQFRNLSEQQLVDCAGDFDNQGCNGGLPSHAFEYIKYNGGLTTEDQYPYMAVTQPQCKLQQGSQVVGVVGGSVNISLSEDDLRNQLFLVGPISVAFQVISGFKDYKSGVYTTEYCKNGPDDVNHAVLAVGYGTENGMDYWIIKNSWSAAWGDNGYFKMQRGVNMCGIVNCNSYPQDVIDLKPHNTLEFLQ